MMTPEETVAEKAALAAQELDRRAKEAKGLRDKEQNLLERHHLRTHLAGMAMEGWISNAPVALDGNHTPWLPEETAKMAVAYADALIAELEKWRGLS